MPFAWNSPRRLAIALVKRHPVKDSRRGNLLRSSGANSAARHGSTTAPTMRAATTGRRSCPP